MFLKAPSAPLYTNFEGGARAKKRNFFCKYFQKLPENGFFGQFFFQKFVCSAENLAKTRTKSYLGSAQKMNSVDLKKGQQKFRFFKKTPLPRENPRSAPAYSICLNTDEYEYATV